MTPYSSSMLCAISPLRVVSASKLSYGYSLSTTPVVHSVTSAQPASGVS